MRIFAFEISGLIDYGQMKSMTVQERIVYAKMIIALSRDDRQEIVRLYFEEMGTQTKRRDPHAAYLLASFWSDRNSKDILGDHNIATFMDYCESLDPMVKMADRYLMACRASVLLRGMGNAFGLQLKTSTLWKEDAEKFLKSQNVSY
jgi:aarF domain-containing kinase